MVEYTYKEAKELLERNLSNARKTRESMIEDAAFLKEQITTCEVSMHFISSFLLFLLYAIPMYFTSNFFFILNLHSFLGIARFFNYDVVQRREQKKKEAEKEGKSEAK